MIFWFPEQNTKNHGTVTKIFNGYEDKDAVIFVLYIFSCFTSNNKTALAKSYAGVHAQSEQSVKLHIVKFETRKSVRRLERGRVSWLSWTVRCRGKSGVK